MTLALSAIQSAGGKHHMKIDSLRQRLHSRKKNQSLDKWRGKYIMKTLVVTTWIQRIYAESNLSVTFIVILTCETEGQVFCAWQQGVVYFCICVV